MVNLWGFSKLFNERKKLKKYTTNMKLIFIRILLYNLCLRASKTKLFLFRQPAVEHSQLTADSQPERSRVALVNQYTLTNT